MTSYVVSILNATISNLLKKKTNGKRKGRGKRCPMRLGFGTGTDFPNSFFSALRKNVSVTVLTTQPVCLGGRSGDKE